MAAHSGSNVEFSCGESSPSHDSEIPFFFYLWSVMRVSHLQEVVAHSCLAVGFSCGEPSHIVCARFMKSFKKYNVFIWYRLKVSYHSYISLPPR